MTSNAGAESIVNPKRLGFSSADGSREKNYELMKEKVMEEVKRLFRPEFLNRIDEILVFHPISREDMGEILGIMLKGVRQRALSELNIRLSFDQGTKDYLIEKGFDARYGARPLRRTIQSYVEDQLAEQILEGRLQRDCSVRISLDRKKQTLKYSVRSSRRKTADAEGEH